MLATDMARNLLAADIGESEAVDANALGAAEAEKTKPWHSYVPLVHSEARYRPDLLRDLPDALINEELYLVYQPIIDLRSGHVIAAEALLRWQHPQHGLITPDQFIPLVESAGLIRYIDEWVMNTASAQIQAWGKAELPHIRVALNVSAGWFGAPGFVDSVQQALATHAVAPQHVVLEITESKLLWQGKNTEHALRKLDELGVGIAIDDFGTGYASLAYLQLPMISYLKIDQSFIAGLPDNANDAAIATALLALAKNLGLTAIAEGIETEEQRQFLLQADCEEGQGYLYSRPLVVADLECMLREQQSSADHVSLRHAQVGAV
ncbi:MAG TPA: EAL domain-containing protein [Salinisphaeraceae bacterium]|nr:EAL domain-containing protein [Salinisphaeraceae bacterium]